MKPDGRHPGRLPLLLATLLALLAVGAWLRFAGGDTRALRAVQAHVEPAIDPQRPLGEVFAGHPHLLRPEWIGAWGGDRRCAAVTLHAASLADLDAACPGLIAPLRGLVRMDSRWAGLATDQPLALQLVFRVADGDGEPRVEAFQVLAVEAWVVFKPEQVAGYETALEESIRHSDDGARARAYRLRHEGERALFDVGLNGPLLAGPGLVPPLAAMGRLAAWR